MKVAAKDQSKVQSGRRLKVKGFRRQNIMVTGLHNSGKTAIISKHSEGQVVTTPPVHCLSSERLTMVDGRDIIDITAWPPGMGDSTQPFMRHCYHDADAIIFVIDCSNRDRKQLEHARGCLETVLSDADLYGTPLLVFANKQDVPQAMSEAEVAAALGLHGLQGRPWHIKGCCANSGQGLADGFHWLRSQPADPGFGLKPLPAQEKAGKLVGVNDSSESTAASDSISEESFIITA